MIDSALLAQIEALLFALGRPLPREELAAMLEVEPARIERALALRAQGGIALVDDGVEGELRVAPEASELVEKVRAQEYSREVGRAGLEALAAIVYRGPLTRSEIDFIRGVNSTQTLRTLLMRGLIRKSSGTKNRASVYEPTTELLATLGVVHLTDLPDYAKVRQTLAELEARYRAGQDSGTGDASI